MHNLLRMQKQHIQFRLINCITANRLQYSVCLALFFPYNSTFNSVHVAQYMHVVCTSQLTFDKLGLLSLCELIMRSSLLGTCGLYFNSYLRFGSGDNFILCGQFDVRICSVHVVSTSQLWLSNLNQFACMWLILWSCLLGTCGLYFIGILFDEDRALPWGLAPALDQVCVQDTPTGERGGVRMVCVRECVPRGI